MLPSAESARTRVRCSHGIDQNYINRIIQQLKTKILKESGNGKLQMDFYLPEWNWGSPIFELEYIKSEIKKILQGCGYKVIDTDPKSRMLIVQWASKSYTTSEFYLST